MEEPMPGDYVQVVGSNNKEIPKGCFAVINGKVGEMDGVIQLVVKPTNPFVTDIVSSGGVMTLSVRKKDLRRSKHRTIKRPFWRWRNGKPTLGHAESFKAEVKLFTMRIKQL
jgi:hypothetical protein